MMYEWDRHAVQLAVVERARFRSLHKHEPVVPNPTMGQRQRAQQASTAGTTTCTDAVDWNMGLRFGETLHAILQLNYQEYGYGHRAGDQPIAKHYEQGVFEVLFLFAIWLLHNSLLEGEGESKDWQANKEYGEIRISHLLTD